MNKIKLFDKVQLLIAIFTASFFLVSIIVYFAMAITSQVVVEEENIQKIVYNPTLQGLYSFFVFGHLLGVVWFVTRLMTFKMRRKEADFL